LASGGIVSPTLAVVKPEGIQNADRRHTALLQSKGGGASCGATAIGGDLKLKSRHPFFGFAGSGKTLSVAWIGQGYDQSEDL
jgi:hypothetical protein